MRTIAVAIHKGGVAKTTTAVNMAAGLARRGHRTLLVDLDAQSNATFWFVEDPSDVDYDMRDVVAQDVPATKVIQSTRIDGLDLLPATLALAPLDVELVSLSRREDRIKRALDQVADTYDFAVLDLAPNLSLVNLAALVAATDIVAPVSAKKLSAAGLGAFLNWTNQMRTEGLITAPLLGTLITMVDARTRVSQEVVETLRGIDTLRTFESTIPYRIGVEDQVAERLVIGDAGMTPAIADAYEAFVDEVVARVGVGVRG